jgi:replicative DNA helicase
VSWRITDILTDGEAIEYGASLEGVRQTPLPTDIPAWDVSCEETGGVGLGDWWYVVVGGASNAGKTQLMLYLARQAAEAALMPGIITMEVPKRGLQRRVYANLTCFGYYDFLPRKWEEGNPSAKRELLEAEVKKYREADEEPRTLMVAEQDESATLASIVNACERMRQAGSRVIFVDHLQLIKAPQDQIADRATEISEALRWFAHSEGCLIVALSQLNRMASRERTRRPTMHDLWGGTSIESNANQVILIDHSQQERDPVHKHLLKTWLYLDKNREGPSRLLIPVEANFRTGIWREAKEDEVGQWPEPRG